jgi:OOP family OmpA-OmpF porin
LSTLITIVISEKNMRFTNLKLQTALRAIGLMGLVFSYQTAFAAEESGTSGMYGGASTGQSRTKLDDARIRSELAIVQPTTNFSADDRDGGYKFFLGYSINPGFAIEAGVFDLGRFNYAAVSPLPATSTGSMRIRGGALDLVGTIPVNDRFSVLGRIGLNHAKNTFTYGTTDPVGQPAPASGYKFETNPKIGLGLQYDLSDTIAMRGEWERFRINNGAGARKDFNFYSVGLVVRFGDDKLNPTWQDSMAMNDMGTAGGYPGYVADSSRIVVRDGAGTCVHTTDWTPEMGIEQCDPVQKAEVPVAPVVVAPAPPPPPPPVVAPPPPPPPPAPVVVAPAPPPPVVVAPPPPPRAAPRRTMTVYSDSEDVLFIFNKAKVKPGAISDLDKFAEDLRGVQYDTINVIGHTDRLGSNAYNMKLSKSRAEAVKTYLVNTAGIPASKIATIAKGETEPVTKPGQCKGNKATPKVIACLQPDRRVDVEVVGMK